jgi:hypothetical protein
VRHSIAVRPRAKSGKRPQTSKPARQRVATKPATQPAITDRAIEVAIEGVVDRFTFVTPARAVLEVRRALPTDPPRSADVHRVVEVLVERGVLTRTRRGRGIYRSRSPLPAPGPDGRLLRLENRCLFLLGTSTPFEQLRAAVKARFEVVEDTGTILAFRWRTATSPAGPTLYLGQCSVEELAHSVKAARIIQGSIGCAVLSFDDRNAVLDEANTLIEAQRVIQTITQRPFFLMWNGARVDP